MMDKVQRNKATSVSNITSKQIYIPERKFWAEFYTEQNINAKPMWGKKTDRIVSKRKGSIVNIRTSLP
jgi:hypothetical protein